MDSESTSGRVNNPPEGRYANYFKIGYNAFELIIDFGQCYSDNQEPQLHTRIVTSPTYGKAFLDLLRESINSYEKTYGQP
jgi:hypothetical protein